MKKKRFAISLSALIAELSLLICFCKLSDISQYYWIGAGLSIILTIFTVYFFISQFTKLISDVYCQKIKYDHEEREQLTGFMHGCLESVNINNENVKSDIKELSELYKKLISDNAEFNQKLYFIVGNMSKANSDSIEKLTAAVNVECQTISNKVTELSVMQVNLINNNKDLINDLKKSIETLASVVDNNVKNSDTLFNKSEAMSEKTAKMIDDLTVKMNAYNDDVIKFRKDVVDVYGLINNAIKKGIDDYTKNNTSFNTTLSGTIDTKLNEYNENFNVLSQKIDALIKTCESNTQSYKESLDFISKSQAESNNLTKEDIKLLQQLINR